MTFDQQTITSINAGLAMERLRLGPLVRAWLAETAPGMRGYRRQAVRQCIAGIRLDLANLARFT